MQNQAAVEALYSATFVEDYIDCVENLPNDLQRHISRLRELDLLQYSQEFLGDLDNLVSAFESDRSPANLKQILANIQKGLIAAQDIGDDKLVSAQAISDLIENKSRQLEHDSKNLDFGNDDEEDEKPVVSAKPAAVKPPKHKTDDKSDKQVKRRKKQHQTDKPAKEDKDDDNQSSTTPRGGSSASSGAKKANKKPVVNKRKQGARKAAEKDNDSDKEIDLSNIEIDPDEPTYCLCDQVSYGEMIGCDNDLCPIEWFHFNCVQLSSKPKGKWYCPKCRGDKSTLMKPKAQFLKELEKYNKEREEKLMKQSNG